MNKTIFCNKKTLLVVLWLLLAVVYSFYTLFTVSVYVYGNFNYMFYKNLFLLIIMPLLTGDICFDILKYIEKNINISKLDSMVIKSIPILIFVGNWTLFIFINILRKTL